MTHEFDEAQSPLTDGCNKELGGNESSRSKGPTQQIGTKKGRQEYLTEKYWGEG
jgi:hypothetical protein